MKKSESIEIAASEQRVWEVAAGEFDRIDRWASKVTQSQGLDAASVPALGDVPTGGRVCATPRGKTTERFVAFDESGRSFTYEVTGDAMPGFVSRATNRWTVEPIDANRARLTMTVEMETRGVLGALMKPMMRFGMGRLLRENLEEIKHYIETGSPHARKRAANERAPDRRGGRAVSRRA